VSLDFRNPENVLHSELPGQSGKDFDMIGREKALHRSVQIRTILAAVAMLAGIVLIGFGYLQSIQVMMYGGGALILCGVMVEIFRGIIHREKQ
jgi:hypothetical protein